MKTTTELTKNTLYLIYDGDCILCRNSAQAIQIKKSVGELELINARESNSLVREVLDMGYDLNEGIVVHYNGKYYYGSDAVNFLALVGSDSDFFNKINKFIFKHTLMSQLFYPMFKLVRNIILSLRKIPSLPMTTQKQLIQKIFDEQTQKIIPNILRERYLNRPYSKDTLLLKGEMNITISKIFSLLSPLFRLTGALVPYPAQKIPASVELTSDNNSEKILMYRTFYYPDQPSYHFRSQVIHIKDNLVIELMRFGLASKLIYTFDNNKISMNYGGYAVRIGKILIPIPLKYLIGEFYACEEATSDDQFNMLVKLTHPLFGKIFQYDGYFKIVKSNE